VKLPDLLGSKAGRMTAFFALYLTEGIPLGFTATAIATQMRRQGLGPGEIGAFVASLYLPWSFKWAVGPFVDVLSSERWGRRRAWIVGTQAMMIVTLLAALPINFVTQLQLFTAVIFLHNAFCATQDVAIDALAVSVLREDERGLANGLMFGGAYLGQTIGGAGVLLLAPHVGFNATFWFVAAAIAMVTLLVALPLRERPGPPRPRAEGSQVAAAGRQVVGFALDSWRAFTGSRAAFLGLIFAILPAGAYALGLALQSNLAVELGLNDTQVGVLNLWTTILSAGGCILGGWLSDRFGRRMMLGLFIAGTTIPTAILALGMHRHGWIAPVDPTLATRPMPEASLLAMFWGACMVYAVFNGLMYGARGALYMDVTTARVAATQFTAYMALLNLVISYSAWWQGTVVTKLGYPLTLALDCLFGLACIALLPFMRVSRATKAPLPPHHAIPEAIRH
jgi:MFS transporter, PAT family, beta-lactamase induction signal transducer AmpG